RHTLNRMSSRISIVGLVALAAWCILSNIATSEAPNPYEGYVGSPHWFVYPMAEITEWSAAIALETAIACGILWRARSVAVASFLLALLFGTSLPMLAPRAIYTPPYYAAQLIFLFFAAIWLAAVAFGTRMAELVGHARQRSR